MIILTEDIIGQEKRAPDIISAPSDVCISSEINGDHTLEFKIPLTEADKAELGRIVRCDNSRFVIEKISRTSDEGYISVKCTHEFVFMAKRLHIPRIASTDDGDFIGEDVNNVLKAAYTTVKSDNNSLYAVSNAFRYKLLTDTDIYGVCAISGDIDYEAEERVTLWDVLEHVIEYLGMGEIWYDDAGMVFAIVEKTGCERDVILSAASNMNNVSIEYDISGLVTVLFPYGENGMDIVNAPQNETGLPSIASPNVDLYGVYTGTQNYNISEIEESGPEKLFNRALWDFDSANPDRIDVPSINISGTVTDMGLNYDLELGDTITVADNGNLIKERIISIKRYPFSGKPPEVSIGRVKKDMFFYLNRIGVFTNRYKNISAQNGKIFGSKVTGTVRYSTSTTSAQTLSAKNIAIDSKGIRILSSGGTFFNASLNKLLVGECIAVEEGKATVNADTLTLCGHSFTVDSDGNLYFDGQKIQIIKEETT